MRRVRDLAWSCQEREVDDDWCSAATETVASYLIKNGIEAAEYYGTLGLRFGGVKIDPSHSYIVLSDGTIVDPTITQYIERGNAIQRRAASGYPYLEGTDDIAVIPRDHPFVKKMGYESHKFGLGFALRPFWVKLNKRAEAARKMLASDADYETPVDLLPKYL